MIKYELNKDGARLAFRDICNTVSGNAKWIREYQKILDTLYMASVQTKSRIKERKFRAAYNELSEQKMVQTAKNQYEITWFLPHDATTAQNKAKVLQGRAMLKQFGLVR